MATTTIRAALGEVRWGYRTVATVRDASLTSENGSTWSLSGLVSSCDDYAVTQRPLEFVVPVKNWRWPIETLQITGSTLHAALAPAR